MVTNCRQIVCKKYVEFAVIFLKYGGIYPHSSRYYEKKRPQGLAYFFDLEGWYKYLLMDREKFYKTVYKLVEDYFTNFNKKPHYLLINSQFDLTKCIDPEDLQQYVNDRFKGMMIVRTPDISSDKVVVY